MDMLITTATSRDEQDRGARVAVLPVGSFEQHGDFLPLITDTIVACVIARRLSTEYGLFLLPRSRGRARTSTPASPGRSASAPRR
jgi:creatinine amidohydrolase